MSRYRRRFWALAACLAGLAGYVDALGFLRLGGFFVSFMSGNSTRLAVGMVTSAQVTIVAGGLVGAFLLGTVAGALAATAARPRGGTAVLLLVAALLFAAAILDAGSGWRSALVLAAAMGCENAVFQRDGEVSIGLTYMTGTLVKLGQRLAAALTGGDGWAWLPHLILWCSMTGGAVAGAEASLRLDSAAVWIAGIWAALLALLAFAIGGDESARPQGASAD